jgi:putative hemolysin
MLAAALLLHGWGSCMDAALNALNESRLRQAAEEEDPQAKRLIPVLDERDAWLESLRYHRAFTALMGGLFATLAVYAPLKNWLTGYGLTGGWLAAAAMLLTLLITTVVMYVFCSVLPRRLGARKPERIALAGQGAVALLHRIQRVFCDGIDGLLGGPPEEAEVTEEDIRLLVDRGEEAGAIEETEKEMIENIFEFNDRTVEEVMTHRTDVEAIWIGDDHDAVVQKILETGLSRFPVYDRDVDDIIGILNIRDFLLNSHAEHPKPMRALLREPYFVPQTVQAGVLFRDMKKRKIHMAIVVDEYGGVSGIATMEDLLEEIVGNIYDEYDPQTEADIVQLEPNLWRIAGTASLEDVMAALDIRLSTEEDYDTLGGLVFNQLTTIPADGTHPEVDVEGLHIRVERMEGHRVATALVSRLIPPEETEEAPAT